MRLGRVRWRRGTSTQGLKQLALPGSRSARDEGVRPVSAQVERHPPGRRYLSMPSV